MNPTTDTETTHSRPLPEQGETNQPLQCPDDAEALLACIASDRRVAIELISRLASEARVRYNAD